MTSPRVAVAIALAAITMPMTTTAATPPVAERHPHPVSLHGDTLPDDYFWLRDKKNPKVIDYLKAENGYADSMTTSDQALRETVYAELLSRIKQTDLTVPYPRGGFLYYTRTEEGKQYPYYYRRKAPDGPEELLIDVNQLAQGHAFMQVDAFEPSPDGRKLAYSTDTTGFRQYVLHVKDLTTGKDLPDHAERVTSVAWASDNQTLFYVQEDAVAKRSGWLYRHALGAKSDDLVYQEKDEKFDMEVAASRSGDWIIQTRASHMTTEVGVLPASTPRASWTVVAPRVHGVEYYLDHRGDEFWILANDRGKNFRLVVAPVKQPGPSHWKELIPHRPEVMLSEVLCFKDHVVIMGREGGLPQITVMDPATHATRRVHFDEAAYTATASTNEDFSSPKFRYQYQSFVTPKSIYDLDLASLDAKLLKRTEVLGGWDASHYAVDRLWATAKDGVRVPVTILYRKGTPHDGSAPCLLYGYGAYGIPTDVTFNSNRFSLVDRGVVFAMAHVRGGGEFGETWHEDGRMANKIHTFTDFIACAEELVAHKVTRADRLVIQGGSAGGLLVGGVTNMRPDLFKGVLAEVPFVDGINSMLDEDMPLTVGEFEEWGNPKVAEQYRWIKAYSPYDNVRPMNYPSILVRTSLNDSQVGYWEGAKYTARLRVTKTDTNPLLFKCNMGAGHGGSSGRYDALRDVAFNYAWILRTVGLASAGPGTAARP